jgi:serine/threonine protein kinase
MALAPGTHLGPYEIMSPLGAGGMGEVYRARDTRLGRDVAVKILPAEFSVDPVRKQRFEREAKTISSLNHPHICVLHDVGSQDGISYLVMECVEGETLAKRLEKGPLPLEQVLKNGMQIADALAKAHRSGVVHRDLKPGNIMLTSTGAKLLDFGLAKPAVPLTSVATLTGAVTQSSPVTEQGAILGTFQYMSPEQVEGKELDGRSDIFSLGAVLYEMMTGQRAFPGKSQLSVASAILEREPAPISTVKPMTPPALDHTVKKCLAKIADERWQSASDVASELRWIGESGSQSGVSASTTEPRRNRERLAWAVVGVMAALTIVGLIAYLRLASSPPSLIVADLSPPAGTQFALVVNGAPALSPDGSALAFSARDASGQSVLWVRPLDGSPARALPGTENSAAPFWSPDSRKIGFFGQRKLQTIEASGGPATVLSDALGAGLSGGTWNREGTILFVGAEGIYQAPASGGQAVLVIRRDIAKISLFYSPRFLPDGKHFLYTGTRIPGYAADAYFASLDGKENRPVLEQGIGHVVYASGFLLYCRGTTLVAQAFDPDGGQLKGTTRPIAEQIGQGASYAFFDASQNGALVYQPAARAATETRLAWFDRSGKRLAFVGESAVHYDVRLSPDAGKIASSVGSQNSEMWVDDLRRGVRMRLTFDPATDKGIPVWSPDGNRILYSTLRGGKAGVGIYEKASSGAGTEQLLLPSDRPDREAWATDWSRDGRFVLFSRGEMFNLSDADIWVLPRVGNKKPSLFLHAAGAAYNAQFSPDGRWVAYTSRESGRNEVYVAPFDAAKFLNGSVGDSQPGGKWQISNEGGWQPRWRGDGRELFYLGPQNTIMAVEVEGKGTSFEVGRSQSLFAAPVSPFEITYDVTADGKRFVMSVVPEEENVPLTVMFNWTAKLKR